PRGLSALAGTHGTAAPVSALLTILGSSLYDTIIVFDRVRENIPRMPRASFSQVVNRSMSEVLTRSLATTFCTLMPILALLLFGGVAGSSELQVFAFALLIGVASGAYSSIFIASPVLTYWYDGEPQYRARRPETAAPQPTRPKAKRAGDGQAPAPAGPKRTREGQAPAPAKPKGDAAPAAERQGDGAPAPAPDVAENEGVAPVQKPKRPAK